MAVRPAERGLGVGRALASAIIAVAAERGYRRMRLDTLSTLRAAIGLYRSLGFAPTEAYYETPLAGTLFMAREIAPPRSDVAASGPQGGSAAPCLAEQPPLVSIS